MKCAKNLNYQSCCSVTSVFSVVDMFSFRPSVSTADRHHRTEDVVPCLPLHERFIWEHASVPADVVEASAGLSVIVAEPIPGVFHNVDLAVRRVRQAMAPRFVVRSGTED